MMAMLRMSMKGALSLRRRDSRIRHE